MPSVPAEDSSHSSDHSSDDEFGSPLRKRKRGATTCCNCKKSMCLKLYCECYAKQTFCGPNCACRGCHNVDLPEFEAARENAVQNSLVRNTAAFFRSSGEVAPRKGCKCKKSQCAKNYCECYQAGVPCMELCRCDTCGNEHGVKPPSRFRFDAAPKPRSPTSPDLSPRAEMYEELAARLRELERVQAIRLELKRQGILSSMGPDVPFPPHAPLSPRTLENVF